MFVLVISKDLKDAAIIQATLAKFPEKISRKFWTVAQNHRHVPPFAREQSI